MYDWLFEECMQKKSATTRYKDEWKWHIFSVGSKNFANIGIKENTEGIKSPMFITVCCEPVYGDLLCRQYKACVPGFYTTKDNNVTVWFDINDVPERDKNATRGLPVEPEIMPPDNVLREMLDRSYKLAFSRLTKKAQKEIADL